MFLRLAFLLALLPSAFINATAIAQEKAAEQQTPEGSTVVASQTVASPETYAVPTWENLIKTMARFGALDFSDPKLVDDYAIIAECKIYKSFFEDEFKWKDIQPSLVQSIQLNLGSYPLAYQYDVSLKLARYDFKNGLFNFTDKNALKGINTIHLLSSAKHDCGKESVLLLPHTFLAVFPTPSFIEGLPLSETEAKALLFRMENEENTDRRVFVRYRFRIIFIEPFKKIMLEDAGLEKKYTYEQYAAKKPGSGIARFDAQIDSIAIYEDEDRTKLLYLYKN